MEQREDKAKLNQSVRKAITLLRATDDDHNANVSSLARAAGLPRATALRMIQTLEQEGFLLRNAGDDRVLLGPELLRLARNTDEQLLLREVSRSIIADLVGAIRETVTLSVVSPDGGLDLVSQVDAPHQLRPRSWVGQRFPLHASASGKILLATFDEERLERFLLEPLARFTPSTITTADALRTELGPRANRGTQPSSTKRRKASPASPPAFAGTRTSFSACSPPAVPRRDSTGNASDRPSASCCMRPPRSSRYYGADTNRPRASMSSLAQAAECTPAWLQA